MLRQIQKRTFSYVRSIKRSEGLKGISRTHFNVNRALLVQPFNILSGRNLDSSSSFHPSLIRSYSTIRPFNLADIGEGIAEVEILQWFVKEGDKIEEFDPICEVQSDKATVEIKSPFEGVVKKLYYEISDMAKVGAPLCDIEVKSSGSEPSSEKSTPQQTKVTESTETTQGEKSQEVFNDILIKGKKLKVLATPAVRHLAKVNNIDLSTVKGTGKDGRVTKGDIINLLEGRTTPVQATPQATPVTREYVPGETKVVKLKGYARAMAKKMEESLSIPHFGYCEEVVMDKLMALRAELKPHFEKKGVKLTLLPFIIKFCSLALKEYPVLNSSISADLTELTYHGSHNIGIAVDTPTGLVVPNIKNVQDLTIMEIAQELQRILELAKNNKLPPQDLSGGTFTLSNIGVIGGTYAKPVVVVPEVCIGALGKIQKLPRFDENGNVVPVHIMQFSWSADHRAVDGASMASFSNKLKQYIENPGFALADTK